jgi:mRNA interferase RelE/StbE
MMPYHVKVGPTAQQQLRALDAKVRKTVLKVVEALGINPRPPGAEKVSGMIGLYTQVIPPVRLLYKIEEQEVLLLVVKS